MSATRPILVAAVALASAATATWAPSLAAQLTQTPPNLSSTSSRPGWRHRRAVAGATGLTAVAVLWRLPAAPVSAACLLVAWLLFVHAGLLLAVTDLATRRLPTPVVAATAAATTALLLVGAAADQDPSPIWAASAGAALLGGGYLAVAVLTPAGAGMGDVRLAAVTGGLAAATGWDTLLLAAVLPYLLGLPFAVVQYRRARRGGSDRHMPFGPFLAAGALTAVIITG